MVRKVININYLKEINNIKNYLRDSPKSEKSLKTYLQALDKLFPYLVNRFKENIEELKDFNLKNYYKKNIIEQNEIKTNWKKNNINDKIFEEWKKLSPEKKSDILMKWVKDSIESKFYTNGKTEKNTYLNYAWRIQGLLSKLGRNYEANPKTMEQLKRNGAKIGSEIEYEDVIELYEKLNNDKYKLILKIMMYSGLNPIDILDLIPKDFKRVDSKVLNFEIDKKYYYVKKIRIKTKHKNAEFLLLFSEEFFNEIKSYFERKIIVQIDKSKKGKIETLKNDKHFSIENEKDNYIKFIGQYNWKNNGKEKIFGNIKSNTVSDTFRYHVEKYNINPKLKPMAIRRLCFTLIKKIFPLSDKHIYDLWTQHKIGLVDNFYITNTLENLIKEYIDKIESIVLIDNLKKISIKINGYKDKVDKIYKIEKRNEALTEKMKKLTEIVKGFGKFISIEYERLIDEKDFLPSDEDKELVDDFKDLVNLMDKIDDLDKE